MSKLVAAINMTIDGFCDHTAGIADDEINQQNNKSQAIKDIIELNYNNDKAVERFLDRSKFYSTAIEKKLL